MTRTRAEDQRTVFEMSRYLWFFRTLTFFKNWKWPFILFVYPYTLMCVSTEFCVITHRHITGVGFEPTTFAILEECRTNLDHWDCPIARGRSDVCIALYPHRCCEKITDILLRWESNPRPLQFYCSVIPTLASMGKRQNEYSSSYCKYLYIY